MGQIQPNVITLNETGLRKRQKLTLSNFKAFNRNRSNGKIMGGVATAVNDKEKDFVVQTKEGIENDEYIITRHSNFATPINIVNVYCEQEPRETKTSIENRWIRILEEIIKIEKRFEACILLGDLNKHIGNDEYHAKISYGGELVRALLSGGNYICLNNQPGAVGGPYTR